MSTDDERRKHVAELVSALDISLGRPPFPNPCEPKTLAAAAELGHCLAALRNAGKLAVLEKEAAVTTTLPVLCASLPEGSDNKRPCLALYREMLRCLAHVCLFSVYPIPSILSTAETILPHDDVVLFELTASAHALTPARLRRCLGVGDSAPTSQAAPVPRKGKRKLDPSATQKAVLVPRAVSAQLLSKVLDTALEPQLVDVFLSLFNTPNAFMTQVGSDGAFACRLLDVYGTRLLPSLTAASLIPSLQAESLPYLIDVVAKHVDRGTSHCLGVLDVGNTVNEALSSWDTERTATLVNYITSAAPVSSAEALAAFIVYALVLRAAQAHDVGHTLLERLCTTVVETATVALRELSGHAPPTVVVVGATGELELTTDRAELILRPLDTVVVPYAKGRLFVTKHGFTSLIAVKWRSAGDALASSLRDYLQTLTRKKPASAAKATQAAKSANSGQGKKSCGKKGRATAAEVATENRTVEDKNESRCFLSTVLTEVGHIFVALGSVSDSHCAALNLESLHAAHVFAHANQRRCPPSAAYASLLEVFALHGWKLPVHTLAENAANDVHSGAASGGVYLGFYHSQLMADAVRVTSCGTWTSSFFRTPSLGLRFLQGGDTDGGAPHAATLPVLNALITAAALPRNSPNESPEGDVPDYATLLSPLSNGAVMGLVGFHIADDQLDSLARTAVSGTAPLFASVQRLLELFVEAAHVDLFLFVSPVAAARCAGWFDSDLGHRVVHGLQRLRDAMSAAASSQTASSQERERVVAEARARIAKQKLAEAARLSAATEAFQVAQAERLEAKRLEQERVREAIQQRRERKAEQQRQEQEALVRKRQQALATMRDMTLQSAAAREEQRKARLTAYKRRQMQAFRVNVFLEQLGLTTARIVEVQRAIQPVMESVTPDDLLEYLVTGVPRVPLDMLDEDDKSSATETAVMLTAPSGEPLPATADGFWASVMNSAGAEVLSVAPSATVQQRSFHSRVAPFLDLFSYQGGDEFGTVPEPLPRLRLRLARRLVPSTDVKEMGFDSLDAVFSRLADRGVVTVQSGVAQLTVMGFRYHFPFHNEERTLEVRFQQNRERVRELLLSRPHATHTFADESRSDAVGWDDESEEEEEEDEDTDSCDQVLPENEFAI